MIKKFIIVFLFGFYSVEVYAQQDSTLKSETNTTEPKDLILFFVEKKAEFPGGDNAFSKYIANNLNYPEDARKNSVEGKVFIQFDIDTSGNVMNAEIIGKRLTGLGDSNDDYCLGQCALDVIQSSPPWTPATQRGKKVKMRMRIPISFRLR